MSYHNKIILSRQSLHIMAAEKDSRKPLEQVQSIKHNLYDMTDIFNSIFLFLTKSGVVLNRLFLACDERDEMKWITHNIELLH